MTDQRMRASSLILVVGTAGVALWVSAGSLTPPGGPVAPTMKTLVQVEPRADVQTLPTAADAAYVISQPGSYYLTANVTGVAGKHGIKIDADNVSLDLRGFALQGVSGANHGIFVNCCHHNIRISDGNVSDWPGIGVDAGLGTNVIIDNIVAFGNGNQGIKVDHGSSVENCTAHSNGFRGIEVTYSCTLSHCIAYQNGFDGFAFRDACAFINCVAQNNSGGGFRGEECNPAIAESPPAAGQLPRQGNGPALSNSTCPSNSTFLNCSASGNAGEGFLVTDQSSFQNCAANGNGSDGFRAADANTFHDCTAGQNSGDGFNVDNACAFQNCASRSNFGGGGGSGHGFNCLSHCTFTGCTAAFNNAPGVEAFDHVSIADSVFNANNNIGVYIDSGTITHTTISGNAFEGINIFVGFTTIAGCTIAENGGHGVLLKRACKVDNCVVANNGLSGIVTDPAADPPANGCQIRGNEVRQNFNDGILVTSDNVVEGNHCNENGSLGRSGGNGAGINAAGSDNRIDGNHLVRNDRGLEVTGASNIITRQTAGGNTVNYDIAAGNKVAVISVAPSSGAINGDTGGAGIGTTDPWGNVAY